MTQIVKGHRRFVRRWAFVVYVPKHHLEHIAEALAVALEPLEAVAGLEVHDAVFAGEPVHAYLAGNAAVFGADGRLGDALVQEGGAASCIQTDFCNFMMKP